MKALFAAALLLAAAAPAFAQDRAPPAPTTPPRLLVVISVDQFSADLFQQYRTHFSGGFARLLTGAVFPDGYQSHAATETCPGHSTILTGMRPAHTGIVANNYVDQSVTRPDKIVYCAEDETAPGGDHAHYTVSDKHLLVPTLGERMKNADPRTRVVSVAGKDRAAVMMGGHKVDELWWWDGKAFASYAGRPVPAVVARANTAVGALLAAPQAALPLPGYCKPLDRPIAVGSQMLGQGRFARPAADVSAFRASPAADASVFALAAGLIQSMNLGKGPTTDIIDIGASATDYIGHTFGTQGTEMCIQMAELDRTLGDFLDQLDGFGIDYEVALTADHGGHDFVERQRERAMPMEQRMVPEAAPKAMGTAIGAALGIPGPVLLAAESDVSIDRTLSPRDHARVLAEALRRYRALPQVAAVFTGDELAAAPMPTGSPDTWSLLDRARASFYGPRSGDFLVLLKPRVTTVTTPAPGYVETHGSPWDYDRRVPILFWRRGMTGFEQPLPVETVDIAPTLAATIRFPVSGLDGRCLDLDPGAASTCPN